MDELLQLLNEINPDVDYANEEHLVENGIYTSLNIVMLVVALSSHFGVEIPPEYIVNENFNSAKSIYAMICKLKNA